MRVCEDLSKHRLENGTAMFINKRLTHCVRLEIDIKFVLRDAMTSRQTSSRIDVDQRSQIGQISSRADCRHVAFYSGD